MPSPEELQGQIDTLTQKLNAALNRIDDLETFATDHLGLDWGESLVDANSPHPNQSVNTLESGGGIVRQDINGMQVATGASDTAAIRYVDILAIDPSLVAAAELIGYASEANDAAGITIRARNSASNYPALRLDQDYTGAVIIQGINGAGASSAAFELRNGSGGANPVGEFRLGALGDNLAYLVYSLLTDDPTNNSLADGSTWYRSDIDKFRGRANSTVDNFAMEAWVTAAIASGSSTTWALSADISPPQITANQNDYAPTGLSTASVLRLNTDASRDITGLTGGSDGRVLLVFNVGSFNIVLKDESASSTAANRFALNGDVTLQPDNSVGLWYDSTSSRWRAF